MALDAGKAWLAFATDAPAPRPTNGAAAASRDGVVVVAPSPADLAAAEAGRAAPRRRTTRARPSTSASPACPPRPAPASPSTREPLLAQRSPQVANTRLGPLAPRRRRRADRAGAELRVPFRITADPVGLQRRRPAARHRPAAAAAPAAARRSSLGLRDPAQTLAFARQAGLLPELDLLDQLPGFLKPDLTDLGPNGTVTSPSLDLTHLTARIEPPDPGDWATKLGRIDTLAGSPARPCSAASSIDQRDGAYTHHPERRARRPRRRLRPRARALQRPDREPARGGGRAGCAPTPRRRRRADRPPALRASWPPRSRSSSAPASAT